MGINESKQNNLWQSTFQIDSKNSTAGIIKLSDKQTQQSYICRKLTTMDRKQMQQMQRLIDVKLSIQSPYLTKVQRVQTQENRQYCAYGKNYYLLFKQPFQTLKQQTLNRKFKKSMYSEVEIQLMMEVGIKALSFLKNIHHPHCNISSTSLFVNQNRSLILGDPFLIPKQNSPLITRNGFIYPSPQMLRYQNREVQYYDKHSSDLFTFGLVLLEVFFMVNMDCVYQRYFQRVSHQAIWNKLKQIRSDQLRKKLFILLDPQPKNRDLIYKFYLKSISSANVFKQISKQKFIKNVERYNLATSQVTEWKNELNFQHRISSSQGKKAISVSTADHFINQQKESNYHQRYQNKNITKQAIKLGNPNGNIYIEDNSHQYRNSHNNYNSSHSTYGNSIAKQKIPLVNSNQIQYEHQVQHPSYIKYNSYLNGNGNYMNQPVGISTPNSKYLQIVGQRNLNNKNNLPLKSNQVINTNYGPNTYYNSHIANFPPAIENNNLSQFLASDINYQTFSQSNKYQNNQSITTPFINTTTYNNGFNKTYFNNIPNNINSNQQNLITNSINYATPFISSKTSQPYNPPYINKQTQNINQHEKYTIQVHNKPKQLSQYSTKYNNTSNDSQKYDFYNKQIIKSNKIQSKDDQKIKETSKVTQTKQQTNPSTFNNQTPTIHKRKRISDYEKFHQLSTINEKSQISDSMIYDSDVDQQICNKKLQINNSNKKSLYFDEKISETHNINQSNLIRIQDYQIKTQKNLDKSTKSLKQSTLSQKNCRNSVINQPQQYETLKINNQNQDEKIWDMQYPSGTRYVGQMKNNKRNGLGTFYYIDGSTYVGTWADNKMHGYGTLYYSTGQIAYQGEWKMDNFHGHGKVLNNQALSHIGAFKYQTCQNISDYQVQYKGDFFQDRKQGQGVLKLSNGQYYQGRFKDDKLHGLGKFHTLDGRIIQGIWQDNKLIKLVSQIKTN